MPAFTAINWDELQAETVRHLQALIRVDSSNPPGNELPAAEYLAHVLATAGYRPLILQSAPGRASLIVRLKGNGSQPPLMIMSHLDVVPADPTQWKHPPFSGKLVDNVIWGRGTIDTKKTTVACLMAMLLIQRYKLPLQGDLVMLAHADEESDFTYGMSWLIRHHRDLFDAPYAIYEGGAELNIAGKDFILVDTAEKGWCTIQVHTKAAGGHSAVPHPDNALLHMGRLLDKLAQQQMPVHPTETVLGFFGALANAFAPEEAKSDGFARLGDALSRSQTAQIDAMLSALPIEPDLRYRFNALMRNTLAPTLLKGGISRWALPANAHLTLNGRLLPGQNATGFERELREILGSTTEYDIEDLHLGTECSQNTPLFQAITRVMHRLEPGVPVIASMLTGGTERGLLQEIGVNVYGFSPIKEGVGQPPTFSLAHAPNERISVDNLIFCSRTLFEVICEANQVVM
ncbi:MAG: M20/M25/M40 family metallo-hydrolase [Chloroflexi bacterium]|nr:M20/M25/M40 family metallo-hydrolase [Chloroflexota bacterium]